MQNASKKFTFSSEEQKMQYLNKIIAFFEKERGDVIGVIAAQNFLDFFLNTFGEEIARKTINDCKKLARERFEDFEIELDTLRSET